MNGFYWNRVIIGLILISVGGIFLLNRIYGLDIHIGAIFSTYWPLILIYFGLAGMIQHKRWSGRCDGSYLWHLIYIAIGLYFLGRNLDVIHFGIGDMVMYAIPAVLILVGIQMIFRPSSGKRKKHWDEDDWEDHDQGWKQRRRDWKDRGRVPTDPEDGPIRAEEHIDLERLRQEPDFLKEDMAAHSSDGKAEQAPPSPRPPVDGSSRSGTSRRTDESKKQGSQWYNPDARSYGGFIGDLQLGEDVWELEDMNISHFIGDTSLDLTKAEVPYGETKLTISTFIGDIKVFVPHDMELEVMVVSSSFLGDKTILDRHEGGMFKHSTYRLSDYERSEKRIRIVASQFIGDLLVQRVG